MNEPQNLITHDPSDWVVEEMSTVQLGDKRLHKRLLVILQRMFNSPVASLKAACRGWAETIATYRFFDNERITEAALLEPHQKATLQRVRAQKRVLVIQDTTEIDYSSKKELEGTGPLSVEQRQGFFAHSQYVVTPERLPLGVWGTKIYARDGEDEKAGRKQQPIEEKESFRWLEGYRDVCRLAESAPDTQTISVSDREGDIYEIFLEWQKRRQQGKSAAEWLIRSCQDRCLEPFEKRQANTEELKPPGKLRAAVEQSPVLGTIEFHITKQEGNKKVHGSRVKTFRRARRVVQELPCIEDGLPGGTNTTQGGGPDQTRYCALYDRGMAGGLRNEAGSGVSRSALRRDLRGSGVAGSLSCIQTPKGR